MENEGVKKPTKVFKTFPDQIRQVARDVQTGADRVQLLLDFADTFQSEHKDESASDLWAMLQYAREKRKVAESITARQVQEPPTNSIESAEWEILENDKWHLREMALKSLLNQRMTGTSRNNAQPEDQNVYSRKEIHLPQKSWIVDTYSRLENALPKLSDISIRRQVQLEYQDRWELTLTKRFPGLKPSLYVVSESTIRTYLGHR
jgi:hypothetical protein